MDTQLGNHPSAMAVHHQQHTQNSSEPINISFSRNNSIYHNNPKLRRESIAQSQGIGGVSWGSVGIGSWLKDEVFMLQHQHQYQNPNLNLNQSQAQNQSQTQTQNHNYQQHQNQHLAHNNSSNNLININSAGPHSSNHQFRHGSINLYNGNFNNSNAMDLRNDSIMMVSDSIPNSSYLADLEANYCKDYSCCGQLLPTLHDLLKHYEEMHIGNDFSSNNFQQDGNFQSNDLNNGLQPQLNLNTGTNGNLPHHSNALSNDSNSRVRNNNSIGAVSTNEVFLNNHLNTKQNFNNNNKKFNMSSKPDKISSFNLNLTYDHHGDNLQSNDLHKTLSNFEFDNGINANNGKHDEMNFDFPNNSANNIFQNDSLVKDLENQAKMFHQQVQQQQQQQQRLQQLHTHQQRHNQQQQSNNNQFNDNSTTGGGNHNSILINNTNSHLLNDLINNGNGGSVISSPSLKNHDSLNIDLDHDTQFQMDVDDDISMGIDSNTPGIHQSINANINSTSNTVNSNSHHDVCIADPARRLYAIEQREERPFQCPVIGCDKTYKNQNGLKYHRLHGHQNQKLRENPDGTFSVINPDSNSPYPHGMAFEKDKPYRCEVCGKRYKNLNGLKYHRAHTTH